MLGAKCFNQPRVGACPDEDHLEARQSFAELLASVREEVEPLLAIHATAIEGDGPRLESKLCAKFAQFSFADCGCCFDQSLGINGVVQNSNAFPRKAISCYETGHPFGIREPPVNTIRVHRFEAIGPTALPILEINPVSPERRGGTQQAAFQQQ